MEAPLFHDNSDRATIFFVGYKTKIDPQVPKSVKTNRKWTQTYTNKTKD